MDFKRLEDMFANMEAERATVSFDEVERKCGEISSSYIDRKHLKCKSYSFAKAIMAAGYNILSVDYSNRTFYVERIGTAPNVIGDVNAVVIRNAQEERNLEARIVSTYEELVSKAIKRKISRNTATEYELLYYCICKRAFGAATAYEHFNHGSLIMQRKEEIVRSAIEKIGQLTPNTNYDEWLYASCRDNEYGMRFGVWQKILNLALKYMYLFYRQSDGVYFADYAEVWDKCHCPVDKIIRGIVVEKVRNSELDADINYLNDITWNFITEEQYAYFQTVINSFCEREGISSKMFFDIIYWERPNR